VVRSLRHGIVLRSYPARIARLMRYSKFPYEASRVFCFWYFDLIRRRVPLPPDRRLRRLTVPTALVRRRELMLSLKRYMGWDNAVYLLWLRSPSCGAGVHYGTVLQTSGPIIHRVSKNCENCCIRSRTKFIMLIMVKKVKFRKLIKIRLNMIPMLCNCRLRRTV